MKKSIIIACVLALVLLCINGLNSIKKELILASRQHQAFLKTDQGEMYTKIKAASFIAFPKDTVAVDENGNITVLTNEHYFPVFPPSRRVDPKIVIGNTAFYPTQVIEREAAERNFLLELSKKGQKAPAHWQALVKYSYD